MLNFLLTSVVWNTNYENNPENSDGPNFGAAEMRSDRKAVRERLEKEHTMNLLSGVAANDGYHKPGSSKDYYQADAPTLRPDGTTALTADDNGRKWIRSSDKRLYVYVHPDWVALSTINANDNTFTGNNTHSGSETFEAGITQNLVTLKTAVLEIGPWNMDTDLAKTVSFVSYTNKDKIRHLSAVIRDDVNSSRCLINESYFGDVAGGITVTSSVIYLTRKASGYFDSSDFSSTDINRGHIYLVYEA